MKYFTQWDDQEIGYEPVIGNNGMAREQVASSASADTIPRVVYSAMGIKRRSLQLQNQNASFPAPMSYLPLDRDLSPNVELLTMFKFDAVPATHVLLYARGNTSSNNHYRGQCGRGANALYIVKWLAGVQTVLVTTSFTFDATKQYWMRFRANGINLALTVWLDGTAEPAPQLTTTDAAISAAGWAGVQALSNGAPVESATFAFLSAASGNDVAVTPRTDAQYYAWLDRQDAQRTVLAEMSYVGQSVATTDFTKNIPVYISNTGYVSQIEDTPTQREYVGCISSVPSFDRSIGLALHGQSTIGFGALTVDNPRTSSDDGAPGVRDDWLRRKWRKSTITMMLGDQSWPRHDFRPFIVGRIGPPTSTTDGKITFPILEFSDAFNEPLQDRLNPDGTYKPILYGAMNGIEPPLVDSATNKYQLSEFGADVNMLYDFVSGDFSFNVYDNGNSLVKIEQPTPGAAGDLNVATDEIDWGFAHGLLPGYVIFCTAGSTGSGIVVGTKYYVKTVPSANKVTLASGSPTGPTVNITATVNPTQLQFTAFGFDLQPKLGTMTLVSKAVGRVVVTNQYQPGQTLPHNAMFNVAFNAGPIGKVERVLNPDFKTGSNFGWAAGGTGTLSGAGVFNAVTLGDYVLCAPQTVPGRRYRITFDSTKGTLGTLLLTLGLGTRDLVTLTAGGTTSIDFVAQGYQEFVVLYAPSGTGTWTINKMSVKDYGLPLAYYDSVSFAALGTVATQAIGLWSGTQRRTVLDTVNEIADKSLCWYGFTSDALMQVGRLDLPSATPLLSFTHDDFEAGSLVQTSTILPIDFSKTDLITCPVNLSSGTYLIGGYELKEKIPAKFNYGLANTAIDEPPQGDAQPITQLDTNYWASSSPGLLGPAFTTEMARLATMYEKGLGVFTFKCRLAALRLTIGDTIRLTAPRMGWKQYTIADPTSIMNPCSFDATLAVVAGIAVNLAEDGPFKVTLTVYRQVPQATAIVADDVPPFDFFVDLASGQCAPTAGACPVYFTRAGSKLCENADGYLEFIPSGEMSYTKLRRVKNLAVGSSFDLSNAAWVKTSATIGGDGKTITATGANATVMNSYTTPYGTLLRAYVLRVKLTRVSGTGNVMVRVNTTDVLTLGMTSLPTGVTKTFAAGFTSITNPITWGVKIVTSGDVLVAEELQLQDLTASAGQTYSGSGVTRTNWPDEYVPVGAPLLNLVTYSEEIDKWTLSAVTVGANQGADALGKPLLDKVIPTAVSSTHLATSNSVTKPAVALPYVAEFDVRAAGYTGIHVRLIDGTGNQTVFDMNLTTGAITGLTNTGFTASSATAVDFGGTWRVTLKATTTATAAVQLALYVANPAGTIVFVGDAVSGVCFGRVNLYQGAASPGYFPVSNAYPYYGAFADGVKYFPTQNQNLWDVVFPSGGTSVLTDVVSKKPLDVTYTLPTVGGYLNGMRGHRRDPVATNDVIWCRDLTNAAWVKTGTVTTSKTGTGVDGTPNASSRLNGGATGGTILQVVTGAAANVLRSFSFRIQFSSFGTTGIAGIEVTMDNGATWTFIKVPYTANQVSVYTRHFVQQTLGNPTVGFRVQANAVFYVDFCQEETGNPSAEIETAAFATTRTAGDVLGFASNALNKAEGTAMVEWGPNFSGNVIAGANFFDTGTPNQHALYFHNAGSNLLYGYLGSDKAITIVNIYDRNQYKLGHRWDASKSDVYFNGTRGIVPSNGSALADDCGFFYLGNTAAGAGDSMTIARATLHRRPLSDDQVIDLVT